MLSLMRIEETLAEIRELLREDDDDDGEEEDLA